MAIVKFLEESYECSKAIKGDNYIHLLDDNGDLIVAFDEIASFDGFAIEDGDWAMPMPEGSCYVAVIREDGTFAKGTHRCSDIARPLNLLDNSDFRNVINQRGKTEYTGSGNDIDRWNSMSTSGTLAVNENSITLRATSSDSMLLSQTIPLEITSRVAGKAVTIAAMTENGKLIVASAVVPETSASTSSFASKYSGSSYIRLQYTNKGLLRFSIGSSAGSSSSFVWAAMYEGEYTAETLPPYVPKGYAVELAECQRYLYVVKPEVAYLPMCSGLVKGVSKIWYNVVFPTKMRITPTFSYGGGTFATNASTYDNISSIALKFADKDSALLDATTQNEHQTVLDAYSILCGTTGEEYLEFSAEL